MTIDPAFFAVFLTAAGAPVASMVIKLAIDALKGIVPGVVEDREKQWAFLLSIGIVVLAIVVGLLETPPRYSVATPLDVVMLIIGAVIAVYGIGRLAMAVHDDASRKPNSLLVPPS